MVQRGVHWHQRSVETEHWSTGIRAPCQNFKASLPFHNFDNRGNCANFTAAILFIVGTGSSVNVGLILQNAVVTETLTTGLEDSWQYETCN